MDVKTVIVFSKLNWLLLLSVEEVALTEVVENWLSGQQRVAPQSDMLAAGLCHLKAAESWLHTVASLNNKPIGKNPTSVVLYQGSKSAAIQYSSVSIMLTIWLSWLKQ